MGTRGKLRVYLGAAPGVGKTYAMLGEGHRRAERGTDVVVGFVETHGRKHTAEMVDGLEVVPRRTLRLPGHHVRGDGRRRRARPATRRSPWSTSSRTPTSRVRATPSAGRTSRSCWPPGIDVITTVNIQHLESVNDVVEKITGVPQRETVPDAVVRAADQIELEDMTAEALRRRLAHGNVYAPEKIDAALSNYFRAGNLNALRELALLWTADRVDDALQQYREQHDITGTWEARERVVVALTGGPEGETLVRRAARIAARSSGGDLLAVHVARSDGLVRRQPGRAGRAAAARRVARRHLPPGARVTTCPRRCSRSPAPRTPPSWCSATAAGRRSARIFSPGTATHTDARPPATSTSTSSPTPTPAGCCRCPTGRGSLSTRRKVRGLRPRRPAAARC